MEQLKSKAQGLIGFTRAVESLTTPEQYAQFIAGLTPATQELVRTPPMPMTWLPGDVWYDLLANAERVLGSSEALCEVGRRQVRADMTGIYKVFVRFLSPNKVLAKAANIYGAYTNDGAMDARAVSEHEGEVTLANLSQPTDGQLHFNRGTIMGAIEATGSQAEVSIIEQAPTFRYRVRWS